jgi:hypothetical protein
MEFMHACMHAWIYNEQLTNLSRLNVIIHKLDLEGFAKGCTKGAEQIGHISNYYSITSMRFNLSIGKK